MVNNLETQGELIFQFKFKGRKKIPCSSLIAARRGNLLLLSLSVTFRVSSD